MPGINMLHANSKTEALLAVAKRCHAQGLHAEADRWRECALLYAAGEGIDGDGMSAAADIIVGALVVSAALAVIVATVSAVL